MGSLVQQAVGNGRWMALVQDRVQRLVIVLTVLNLQRSVNKQHSKPEQKSLPLTFSLPMYRDRTFSNYDALPSAYNQSFTVARGTIIFIVQEANLLASLFKHSH
jgi:hypothetical protein